MAVCVCRGRCCKRDDENCTIAVGADADGLAFLPSGRAHHLPLGQIGGKALVQVVTLTLPTTMLVSIASVNDGESDDDNSGSGEERRGAARSLAAPAI